MNTSIQWWGMCLAILGGLAVALGAFGAHILGDKISSSAMETYRTAVLYNFVHVIMGLIALVLMVIYKEPFLAYAYKTFTIGILFFSGSLYLLSLKVLLNIESWSAFLGPITPIGGLFFIIGWILLAIGIFKSVRL